MSELRKQHLTSLLQLRSLRVEEAKAHFLQSVQRVEQISTELEGVNQTVGELENNYRLSRHAITAMEGERSTLYRIALHHSESLVQALSQHYLKVEALSGRLQNAENERQHARLNWYRAQQKQSAVLVLLQNFEKENYAEKLKREDRLTDGWVTKLPWESHLVD